MNKKLEEIRCPKCGKFICKKEEDANTKGIYFWCSRCKKNFEINNSAQVADDKK